MTKDEKLVVAMLVTLAVIIISYLVMLHSIHSDSEVYKILACSDKDDYAKIPKQFKQLCGRNKP